MFTGRLFGSTPSITWSSMTISPTVGYSNPASMRSSVVLPQPDGPSSAKNSPSTISKQASSTAVTCSPNRLVTLQMEMLGFFWLSMSARLLAAARLDPHGDDGDRQRQHDQHRRGGVDFRRPADTTRRANCAREGWRAGP